MSSAADHHPELVTLIETATAFEAQAIAAALADADIDAIVVEPSALDVAVSAARRKTTAQVRVRADDQQRARTALEESRRALDEIDWEAMPVDDHTPIHAPTAANRVLMWLGFTIAVVLIVFVFVVGVIMLIAG